MRGSQDGFTLVEVLVATMIVGLALAATGKGLQQTTNLLGENEIYAEATAAAQAVVEDLRTVPYEDIGAAIHVSADGTFAITTDVLENSPDPGMKEIVVTAAWTWKGRPRSYALHTVYSKLTKD